VEVVLRIRVQSFFVAALLLVGSGVAFAHGVTMKLRHPLPADSAFHTQFVVPWTEKVHHDAGGRISFQIQAGDAAPEKLLDAVRDADADVVWTDLASTGGRLSSFEPFELPLLTKDALGASRALIDYARLSDAAQNELDGVQLLTAHQLGAPVFHMRSKPLASVEDLRGARIGVMTPAARLLLTRAGAAPVDLRLFAVSAALNADELDGALLPWDLTPAASGMKFHAEIAPARLDAPVFVLLMNTGTWKGLADDLKKVIQDNSGADAAAALIRAFEADGKAARKSAADRGEAITVMPAEEVAKLQPAAQAAVQDWLDAPGKRGRKQALDAAREALGN